MFRIFTTSRRDLGQWDSSKMIYSLIKSMLWIRKRPFMYLSWLTVSHKLLWMKVPAICVHMATPPWGQPRVHPQFIHNPNLPWVQTSLACIVTIYWILIILKFKSVFQFNECWSHSWCGYCFGVEVLMETYIVTIASPVPHLVLRSNPKKVFNLHGLLALARSK